MSVYDLALKHFYDELETCKYNQSDLIISLDDAEKLDYLLTNYFTITEKLKQLNDEIENIKYFSEDIIENLEDLQ